MRYDIIKSIDFKQVRTIITKEESDLEEWKKCIAIPFMLLGSSDTYSVVYCTVKKHRNCGYSIAGTPEILYKRISEKVDDASQVFIVIKDKNNRKDQWFISRD